MSTPSKSKRARAKEFAAQARLVTEIGQRMAERDDGEQKHTPGPYVATRDPRAGQGGYVISDERHGVVLAHAYDAEHACLFAAAPELLAAVLNLVEAQRSGLLVLSSAGVEHDFLSQALDAIERARSAPASACEATACRHQESERPMTPAEQQAYERGRSDALEALRLRLKTSASTAHEHAGVRWVLLHVDDLAKNTPAPKSEAQIRAAAELPWQFAVHDEARDYHREANLPSTVRPEQVKNIFEDARSDARAVAFEEAAKHFEGDGSGLARNAIARELRALAASPVPVCATCREVGGNGRVPNPDPYGGPAGLPCPDCAKTAVKPAIEAANGSK